MLQNKGGDVCSIHVPLELKRRLAASRIYPHERTGQDIPQRLLVLCEYRSGRHSESAVAPFALPLLFPRAPVMTSLSAAMRAADCFLRPELNRPGFCRGSIV